MADSWRIVTPKKGAMTGAVILAGIIFEGDDDDAYPVADCWDYADSNYHCRAETDAIDAWLELDADLTALNDEWMRREAKYKKG